jgi:hypothetical protein
MTDKSELRKIFSFVQKLETRITELESKDAVLVTGSKKNHQPQPLKLSLDKLIDIYNDVPQLLVAYAVEVTVNSQSYRQKNEGNLILQSAIRGKYWVILLENNYEQKYYLLPNAFVKIKLYRTKSINYLFNLTGETNQQIENFHLVKPSELEILPSGEQWQLINKGELFIGYQSPALELVSEIEEITKKQEKTTSTIQDLINILKKINIQNKEFENTLKDLEERLTQLETEEKQLINLYQKKPDHLIQLAINNLKLKLSTKTINNVLQGNIKDIFLEANNNGEYIVVKSDRLDYLFPNPQVIFDKQNLMLANQSKLFIAQNEMPIAILGKDIQIIKPAQITQFNNSWVLLKSGEIKF